MRATCILGVEEVLTHQPEQELQWQQQQTYNYSRNFASHRVCLQLSRPEMSFALVCYCFHLIKTRLLWFKNE